MTGRLELEELRDVTHVYHDACAAIAQRFGAYIAERRGSRLLLYFGYPAAREDDAQRAVHAGLALLKALETFKVQLAQEKSLQLAARLGIHTGLVVIEDQDGSRPEPAIFGEPLTIAEQIRDVAPSGAVAISDATAHLAQGYFVCQDMGLHSLAGMPEPVRLFRVVEASGAQSRLEIVGSAELTPFVGRETEMSLLLDRWAQVQEGSGQVVLLSGEAGIGKSRLAQVMRERLPEHAYTLLDLRCSPSSQNSVLYPVIDFFHRRVLQWRQDDTPREKIKKLEIALAQYEIPLSETVPLLAALFSLPHPGDCYPPLQLTPPQQREKTLGAIVTVVLALAANQPVLLTVEDAHWVDPSTLELLTLLVDQTPATPIYTLLTCRPAFENPWGNRSYLTQITLSHLSRQQVEQMIAKVTRGKSLPAALLQRVVEQTDGVPLFIEEYTKSILEAGLVQDAGERYELTEPLPDLIVPATLHDSLMARLDRLGTAKSVAQLGAAIGRQFPYGLLRVVWQQDETLLQQELDRLVEAELVHQRGLRPQAVYVFKHALIQEAAYQSLLRRTRRRYHQQIAQVLDEQFPETAALQPELLAHHYTEAGLSERAVPYWQLAGELAVERSANAEAVNHFNMGLEALKNLPAALETIHQELTLQLALGAPLLMLKGHTSPEAEDVYNRAYELAHQLGETPQRFSALVGLWRLNLSYARLQKACNIGKQCLILAQNLRDQALLQESHLMLGSVALYMGELPKAQNHLEQGISLYDAGRLQTLAFSRATDPGVVCLSRLSWVLWILGYPDSALHSAHEAMRLAQQISHPYSIVFACFFAALIHQCRREIHNTQELSETVMKLSGDHGFILWSAEGLFLHGWALSQQASVKDGVEQMHQGLLAMKTMGVEVGQSSLLIMLVEVYIGIGDIDAVKHLLSESYDLINKNDEYYYESEWYRVRGEMLLEEEMENNQHKAEEDFQYALDCARRRHSKSLELRAAKSLSRLWNSQGRRDEARYLLEETYNWFSEGFHTFDLEETRSLIESLR